MSINIKELKKLAAACRAAGIKHYKSADFEFTLTDELPEKPKKGKSFQATEKDSVQGKIDSDGPTEEQLLFWSSNPGIDEEAAELQGST